MMWDRVDIGEVDQCWPWTGAISRGYGQTRIGGLSWQVHRVAFIEATGDEPPVIDHDCHNRDVTCPGGWDCRHRRCCNPAHLTASTHRDNLLASPLTLASREAAKTHCPQNHPYDEENTYVTKSGLRQCRECSRIRSRENQRRRRAAATK